MNRARAFLETEMPVKDFMQATGSKTPPTGFGVDGKVYGSAMFGPKIGNGFFQNLIGNYEPLTQDLVADPHVRPHDRHAARCGQDRRGGDRPLQQVLRSPGQGR